jgi:hypothetical protein
MLQFINDKRDEYRRKHPHLKITEVTKKLAEQWARMAESQKIVCFFFFCAQLCLLRRRPNSFRGRFNANYCIAVL